MRQPRLCLHTQTPLVRFLRDFGPLEEGRSLSSFREGEDYVASPGGVTRMVGALLGRLDRLGRIGGASWLTLASQGPQRVVLAKHRAFEQVRLAADDQAAYATAKGALWDALHGIPAPDGQVPDPDAVAAGLARLADAMARRTRSLHAREPFDLFYTHDFQLLPLASRLPQGPPKMFRWHVPVTRLPPALERRVVAWLDRYDAVVVSTQGYADALRRAGVTTPVHASYPYVDEARCRVVTTDDVAAFDARHGLGPDDVVFTLVARLDPMKRQDVAIRALARIAREAPEAKLLLVGGGGFSGGRAGLGLPQAGLWRARLEALARDLGLRERVLFAGNVPDADLDVAYTRSRAVLLPSAIEGFGLAAVEGWLYGRPVLVSRGAGVAELVEDEVNGFTHEPGDEGALARHMLALARDEARAHEMGLAGRVTARACHVRRGADAVWDVMRGLLEERASRDLREARG